MWTLALAALLQAGQAWGEDAPFPAYRTESAREYLQALGRTLETQAGTGAETRFLQARLQTHLGRQDEAERLARACLAADPKRVEIQSFLADVLIRQDRMEEAATLLRAALSANPSLAGGNRRLGMVLDRLGDSEGAGNRFEQAVSQDPRDATARLLLGRWLLDHEQARAALSHLEKAHELEPDSANALYVLAESQKQVGEAAAAARSLQLFRELKAKEKTAMDRENAAYDDARSLRAAAVDFHLDAAALLAEQRQSALAEAHLRQTVRVAPEDPRGHEALARFLFQAGRLPEARTSLEAWVALRPREVTPRLNLGTLLLQLKDSTAAVAQLQQVLAIDPHSTEALNNLARYYLGARRDLPEALALCRRLVVQAPTAASYDLLGWACYANGRLEEARAASDQAVAKDPQNAVYRERNRRLKQIP